MIHTLRLHLWHFNQFAWLHRLARKPYNKPEHVSCLSDHMRRDIGLADACGRTRRDHRDWHHWV